jgi:hypothetical protein
LKVSFTIVALLIHTNPSKPFVSETNKSNFVIGIVLSQLKKDNFFHPVDFRSHKFSLVEINYEIHDKELLAIVDAFEEWCHLFEGIQHEIIMYLNQKNLQYFKTIHVLNRHQAQWALSLF